jgi:alginate O-acetyltransferase complex protein AlgJ
MRGWLASRGIKFYVLFPPDKHTIYPEYLPASIERGPSPTRLDVLTAALRSRQVDVVDIRQPLLQAKGSDILFHRTDSHWNGYAGFIAYQALLAEMSRSFPQLQSFPRSHFTRTPVSHTGDLAAVLGLTYGYDENLLFLRPPSNTLQRITSPSNKVVIAECNDPRLPRMVMLRDSFANFVVDLLSENFRRAVYVWDYRFDPGLITREQPDLVVFEMVERGLETTSNNSLVLKDLALAGNANAQANRP